MSMTNGKQIEATRLSLAWSSTPPAQEFRTRQLRKRPPCEQVAAVCFRVRDSEIEFLLVRTRSGRWTFPKGASEPGMTFAQAAALEAYEEAGVHGRIEEAAFIHYRRERGAGRTGEYGVNAFLCEVSRLSRPRETQRNRTWLSPARTIQRLTEGRTRRDGAEFARVVDRAVARINRLRSPAAPAWRGEALGRVRIERSEIQIDARLLAAARLQYIHPREDARELPGIGHAMKTYSQQKLSLQAPKGGID
jgi:8-oxo-dGTP pyrophosphatase MutT (NUDIX family)